MEIGSFWHTKLQRNVGTLLFAFSHLLVHVGQLGDLVRVPMTPWLRNSICPGLTRPMASTGQSISKKRKVHKRLAGRPTEIGGRVNLPIVMQKKRPARKGHSRSPLYDSLERIRLLRHVAKVEENLRKKMSQTRRHRRSRMYL